MNQPSAQQRLQALGSFISLKNLFSLDVVIVLVIGVGGALGLYKTMGAQTKWLVAMALVTVFFCLYWVVEKKSNLLLFCYFLILSINLNWRLIYDTHYGSVILPIYGVAIYIYHPILIMLLFLWALRIFYNPEEKFIFYPAVILPMLLILSIAILGHGRSVTYPYITYMCIGFIAEGVVIVLFFSNYLRTPKDIYVAMYGLMASLAFQCVVGFGQAATGGALGLEILGEIQTGTILQRAGVHIMNRVGGTLGHPNSLARYLGMMLPLNMALVLAPINGKLRFFILLPILVCGLILDILTYSRGGWISLAIALAIVGYWFLFRRLKSKIGALILLLFMGVLLVGSLILGIESLRQRLFEDDYGQAQSRIPMMQVARNMVERNPLIGVGIANYATVAHLYDDTGEAISYNFPFPVHNEYMLIAAELGAPALGAFIIILLMLLWMLYKQANSNLHDILPLLSIGLFGGLVTICIRSFFDYSYILLRAPFWSYVGLILAIECVLARIRRGEIEPSEE